MGRILDLLTTVASEAEEGGEGLVLGLEASEKLLESWTEEDLEDALGLVHDTLLQDDLVEAADSLSARLVEILGSFGSKQAYQEAERTGVVLPLEIVAQVVRRVSRLEQILGSYREHEGPGSKGFEDLQARLADRGLEKEMTSDDEPSE